MESVTEETLDGMTTKQVEENQSNFQSPFNEQDEVAAKQFVDTLNKFIRQMQKIKSMNSLARVFREVAEFPLGASTPNFVTDRERKLFIIFQELVEHKTQILTAIMQKGINQSKGDIDGEQILAQSGHVKKK